MPNPHWQPFFVAAALIAISPGANQLLSLRDALRQGFTDAVVGHRTGSVKQKRAPSV
ncbi:hypothetical protein ACTD5D_17225 [Nocardia takedensis]|uniref:hypothetical protein n=1 Tax=Nocardia takedensis TaxID=259390 RepID=UPI00031B9886|nr:hypothetical protein [Nocardia takedensis]